MHTNLTAKIGRAAGPGILLVLLTVLISGVSNFVNFYAVQGTSSDAFLVARNVLVAVLLLPLGVLATSSVRGALTKRDWAKLATIGLIGGAIPFLLFFRGLQMAGASGAATATFGYRTLFLMASVLGIVFLRERLSSRLGLAAVLLLAGNVLLLTLTAPVWTDGTILVLAATGLWAAEYTLSKHTLRNVPSGTVALSRMGFGALFLVGYIAATGQLGAIGAMSGVQWEWVALSAVLLVGFVTTWYAGLKTVDVSVATAVLTLAFPITWVLGVFASKSPFGVAQAVGVVAIVAGVVLAIGLVSLRETWETVLVWVRSKVSRSE